MHWKTQNTACSYAHGDTFLFSFGDIPPFKHENYLPVYNFISLSSQPSSSSSKRKEKVLVAFFENISVADIF
jgi:hypothetical protein